MGNTSSIPAFSILSLGSKSSAESPCPIMRCCPKKPRSGIPGRDFLVAGWGNDGYNRDCRSSRNRKLWDWRRAPLPSPSGKVASEARRKRVSKVSGFLRLGDRGNLVHPTAQLSNRWSTHPSRLRRATLWNQGAIATGNCSIRFAARRTALLGRARRPAGTERKGIHSQPFPILFPVLYSLHRPRRRSP